METADAVVRDRWPRLVDVVTARGVEVPRGQELLWQATSAVVGEGNWKARVLKPSTTFALERVSVERMRKWSGGEKVTISLLLFCMVAKLRATSRGRDLPGLGAGGDGRVPGHPAGDHDEQLAQQRGGDRGAGLPWAQCVRGAGGQVLEAGGVDRVVAQRAPDRAPCRGAQRRAAATGDLGGTYCAPATLSDLVRPLISRG
ncbi:hypothetical protein [Pseudonocardia sp. H11422]|uniref:hypothetical protein n=1 Tax=Pseudonocardia sp. H11422 TaxID=2835866 RepID=UPI00293058B3|nr:hypothetical protein [Pseudonocardia sp. H11422]